MLPLAAFTSSTGKVGYSWHPRPLGRKQGKGSSRWRKTGSTRAFHLDLEHLPPEGVPKSAGFLKKLNADLNGRKLTTTVFLPHGFPAKWSSFRNLELIGPLLDEIVLMCYDYHRPGAPAGPVVDLEWAERKIARVLQSVRPEKV